MAVEIVDGVKVASVEPFTRHSGPQAGTTHPLVNRLILEDGRKFYHCKVCDYVSSVSGNATIHAKRNHQAEMQGEAVPEPAVSESSAPTPANLAGKAVMEMTVGELLEYGTDMAALRERAETAEARVRVLEEQLAGVRASLGL